MEKELTITQVFREQKTSQRTGKPFESLRIKTAEYGDTWLSGFGNAQNKDWQEGTKVMVTVEEKQVGDRTFYNFSMPKNANGTDRFTVGGAEIKNLIKMEVIPLLQDIQARLQAGQTTKPDTYPGPAEEPDFGPEPESGVNW